MARNRKNLRRMARRMLRPDELRWGTPPFQSYPWFERKIAIEKRVEARLKRVAKRKKARLAKLKK